MSKDSDEFINITKGYGFEQIQPFGATEELVVACSDRVNNDLSFSIKIYSGFQKHYLHEASRLMLFDQNLKYLIGSRKYVNNDSLNWRVLLRDCIEEKFREIKKEREWRIVHGVPEKTGLCPICNTVMVLRSSRNYVRFWGCINYPKCTHTKPIVTHACDLSNISEQSQLHHSLSERRLKAIW